ncbi:MAG: hypothetical protein WAS49_07295 [Candidatus Dechloromonas phosphoritropha]|jgi:hypothetical protein|nr:hypothetical protein [Candidatus Dechloromonas phosphoritropha]MBP8786829.1 hypothetical protein [Azonexus sp.]MBP9227563.1 hypothetical protein [Azonexus sp.]
MDCYQNEATLGDDTIAQKMHAENSFIAADSAWLRNFGWQPKISATAVSNIDPALSAL